MTLEGGYNERVSGSPLQYQKPVDDSDDPLLRTPLQIRDSIIGTISRPPVIVEARFKKKSRSPITIEIRDCPESAEKSNRPTDLTIFIPLDGNQLGDLFNKTDCGSLNEIINRIQDIAIDCGLGFLCAVDREGRQVIANLHKIEGATYNKIMDNDRVSFINCFQNVLA